MRKLLVLVTGTVTGALALVTLAAGVASAVPCGPSTCAPFSVAPTGGNVMLVRWQGSTGPVSAYNLTSGKAVAKLPGGVLAANGRSLVAGTFAPSVPGTTVTRYDARSGARLSSWAVRGVPARVAAVSATGRYAALIQGEESPTVRVVDLDRRVVLRSVELQGHWQVDALSRDASRLYLLENLADGSYRVRVDIAGRGLLPGAITDPAESEPMVGFPWTSVATPDGRWQLTLFVKASETKTEAFIHALRLDRGTAKCIDLSSGEFMSTGRYALVVSPDGRTLYAANPSVGRVAVVDLARRAVTSTVRFPASGADSRTSSAFGAISRDGLDVFFSAGEGLHAFDTRTHAVRRLGFTGPIVGVGVVPDGKALLAVGPTMVVSRLDARTGAALTA
jgi:DNA-binding beta-propeller fold protein YncE